MSVAVPLTAQPPEPAQTQAQRNAPAQAPEKPSADKPAAEKPSAEKPSAVPAETAQPQVSEKPPAAAEATQPPAHDSVPAQPAETSENGRPRAAETPFAEVFSQLAGRLVGVVVNVSTQMAPQPKGPQDAPQPSPSSPATPGTPLDEFFRDFFGEKGAPGGSGGPRAASLGSGFIVDPSGLIVTNNHVIANSQQITVTLSDNTAFRAQVVGRDAITDLALLKVDAKAPLPAAQWGDSNKARVGDWVLAIGNPFGLGGTVTAGIISATARDIHSGPYDDYLQTDASINRGNSGGPMFNLAGEVIGINTAIFSPSGGSIGIGFAIPADTVESVVAKLREHGAIVRGW
ncbi:MAG: trypsin-like peptidase domain-containing protein, partial [Alphaproteobacteria bacterium]|nr:trypsin-like peptidase domain-containing protein [Alphaproteobacteria bacterium]